jgi:hypothetical protein
MNSALARRSRSVGGAATDYTLFLILVGASIMGLATLAVGNWAISRSAPVAQDVDSAVAAVGSAGQADRGFL